MPYLQAVILEMTMMEESYKKNGLRNARRFHRGIRLSEVAKIVMVKWVWDFVLRLDCQYDGGKVPTLSAVPYYGGCPLLKKNK
jgi:hypothetical protein